MSKAEKHLYCSFCGKEQRQVKRLFKGDDACICNECIGVCVSALYEEQEIEKAERARERNESESSAVEIPIPQEIHSVLDRYIIGQERAKIALSVAVYNHYKRIIFGNADDVELQKSNILLIGPTGCGKTLFAQTLARVLNVPFAIADATTLTEAGYVGDDVENILLRLVQAADYDIELAERGIIYVDEIDKISRKSENTSITRDVSGEGVQQSLLKLIEGTVANVPPQGGRKHPHQEFIQIDTKNILFICGGAFDGLEKIIERRLDHKSIGFEAEIKSKNERNTGELFSQVQPHDLIQFGIIPELVGRLPVLTALESLSRDQMVKILTEPKNAIVKQYQQLLRYDDVELEFQPEALAATADQALERNIGARGLRAVMEEVLTEVMYAVPSDPSISKVVITPESILEGATPQIIREQKAPAQDKAEQTEPSQRVGA